MRAISLKEIRDAIDEIENMTKEEREKEKRIQMSQIEASQLTVNHVLGSVSGESILACIHGTLHMYLVVTV